MVEAPHRADEKRERRVEEGMPEPRTSTEQLRQKITELERSEAAGEERLQFETLLSELLPGF